MDTGSISRAVTGVSWRPLKEPRGFIRIVEWILAIFAFATTCGFDSYTSFVISCGGTVGDKAVRVPYSYPFRLTNTWIDHKQCPNSTLGELKSDQFHLAESYSGPSQFFVAVGVICFLYCIVSLFVYLFLAPTYRENANVANGDLIMTAVLAVFWLISSAAWAKGLSDLKYGTSPSEVIKLCKDCKTFVCAVGFTGKLREPQRLIICGFLNWMVWMANIWFLYKESTWFKDRGAKPATPGQYTQQDFPGQQQGVPPMGGVGSPTGGMGAPPGDM
ncbi:PREDICTED: synaptophysin-like [Priapulus caudatus]|uniref:Synaptophysin-like n=1 Tax=Priapulus caudatus TaxID=37621 RepID=A0ABM1EYV7_PRICU|nr:PREDICTED: synaptophysin-like [Priapulus caudatus]